MLAERFYQWLRSGPTPDCDDLLAAGLPHADGVWREKIVGALLNRGHEASWAALLGAFDQLPPGVQATLDAEPQRIVNALGRALKAAEPAARCSALQVFRRHGLPGQLYLVADALRDSSRSVREAAAAVLHERALAVLQSHSTQTSSSAAVQAAGAQEDDRNQVALALREAVRTFDLHRHAGPLEAALWFTREIGPELWVLLHNPRSNVGKVIAEKLPDWNRPAIAPFLLAALRHVAWRNESLSLLRRWTTREHVAALLRCTAMLDDPEIRRQLAHVPAEISLSRIDRELKDIPRELAPCLPRWAISLGAEPGWRARFLIEWCDSPNEPMRRAAVYALAEIDHPEAAAVLERTARETGALAAFARWRIAGETAPGPRGPAQHSAPRPVATVSAGAAPAAVGESFPVLWQACRRTPPRERGPLLEVIREHADAWQRRLRDLLRSADARDRLMVLQVVGTQSLLPLFRGELEPLKNDPVEAIRKVVSGIMAVPGASRAAPSAGAAQAFDPDRAPASNAHGNYVRLIRRLESNPTLTSDPNFAQEVRTALRWLRDEQTAAHAGGGQ